MSASFPAHFLILLREREREPAWYPLFAHALVSTSVHDHLLCAESAPMTKASQLGPELELGHIAM